MPTTPEAHALTHYLQPRLDAYVEELRQLCAIECPTTSKPGVDEAGAWVRLWGAARGWDVRDLTHGGGGATLWGPASWGCPRGSRLLSLTHLILDNHHGHPSGCAV